VIAVFRSRKPNDDVARGSRTRRGTRTGSASLRESSTSNRVLPTTSGGEESPRARTRLGERVEARARGVLRRRNVQRGGGRGGRRLFPGRGRGAAAGGVGSTRGSFPASRFSGGTPSAPAMQRIVSGRTPPQLRSMSESVRGAIPAFSARFGDRHHLRHAKLAGARAVEGPFCRGIDHERYLPRGPGACQRGSGDSRPGHGARGPGTGLVDRGSAPGERATVSGLRRRVPDPGTVPGSPDAVPLPTGAVPAPTGAVPGTRSPCPACELPPSCRELPLERRTVRFRREITLRGRAVDGLQVDDGGVTAEIEEVLRMPR